MKSQTKLVVFISCLLIVLGYVNYSSKTKNPKQVEKSVLVSPSSQPVEEKNISTPENDCRKNIGNLGLGAVSANEKETEINSKAKLFIKSLNAAIEKGRNVGVVIEELLGLRDENKEDQFINDSDYSRKYLAKTDLKTYEAWELQCPDSTGTGPSLITIRDLAQNKIIGIIPNDVSSVVSFADLDGDGSIELLSRQFNGGNCWNCDSQFLYRIENGNLQEIENGIRDIVPTKKNEKGLIVKILDTTWEVSLAPRSHSEGIGLTRYMRIYGNEIKDITPEYKDQILQEIESTNDPEAKLLMYETIGERQKGMQVFESDYVKLLASEDYAGTKELRETILNEFRRQFKEQEKFTPFDTNGVNKIIPK